MTKKTHQKNNIPFFSVGMVLTVLFLISACNKEQVPANSGQVTTSPPAKSDAVAKPVQKQASSAAHVTPAPVNQFDFSNKKDPFKPFVVAKVEQKSSPENERRALRNALPIHSFDVNQFRLIGIITGGRENQAMVTDPNGKGYVLKTGMLIGKNDGKIVSINSNGVDVLEQFRDDNGKVRKENIKLTLPRKQ